MQTVNKRMDPKKTLQTMQDFQKENFKMGMTEDMRKFWICSGWFLAVQKIYAKWYLDYVCLLYMVSFVVFF